MLYFAHVSWPKHFPERLFIINLLIFGLRILASSWVQRIVFNSSHRKTQSNRKYSMSFILCTKHVFIVSTWSSEMETQNRKLFTNREIRETLENYNVWTKWMKIRNKTSRKTNEHKWADIVNKTASKILHFFTSNFLICF